MRNYSVKVKRSGEDIKFLHKIVEGGTDDSYGIEVARLAGLPKKVTDRAKQPSLKKRRKYSVSLNSEPKKNPKARLTSRQQAGRTS